MDITSAPSLFPASSNELCVLVEGSKNKLICVFPLNMSVFFDELLFNVMNVFVCFRIFETSEKKGLEYQEGDFVQF